MIVMKDIERPGLTIKLNTKKNWISQKKIIYEKQKLMLKNPDVFSI